MNQNELMIRGLVREWLLVEKMDEDIVAAGLYEMHEISKINKQLDNAIDRAGNQSTNEAILPLVAGTVLSIPTLAKWGAKVISMIVKSFGIIATKFDEKDNNASDNELAQKIEKVGIELYHKGHHLIHAAWEKIITGAVIAAWVVGANETNTSAKDAANTAKAWCKGDGKKAIKHSATCLDLAVTSILAVYSVKGAVHAIETASTGLAGAEAILTAVKGSHITEAVTSAIVMALDAVTDAINESSVAAALLNKIRKNLKSLFTSLLTDFKTAIKKSAKIATAAGISASLILSPDSAISNRQIGTAKRPDLSTISTAD